MGSPKTVFSRLLPDRAVRRSAEDASAEGETEAVEQSGAPSAAPGKPLSDKAKSGNLPSSLIVMALLGADVLLGAAIGLTGFYGLQDYGIALMGAVLATGGILLMLFFQVLGKGR